MPYTTLISTRALAENLDANWIIADCRYDLQNDAWGEQEYLAAHIPDASYVSLSRDLSAPLTGTNGRHPLPSHEAMTQMFGRLGISGDIQVVAYDQDCGMYASRFWWMLRYAGHANVAVLDGGWAKWIAEQRPTRSGVDARPAATFTPKWRTDWNVDVNQVAAISGGTGELLLDARAPERFEGSVEPIDRVPGHIPGASNYPYRSNLTDNSTLLPPELLRQQFERALGGYSPSQTVVYCGSGVSACHNLLAMEHAGLPGARLYVGSWSEWSADPNRPVETGPDHR
jgi:thiosulfate/3-mercaptopyruvate sulfurtransferase